SKPTSENEIPRLPTAFAQIRLEHLVAGCLPDPRQLSKSELNHCLFGQHKTNRRGPASYKSRELRLRDPASAEARLPRLTPPLRLQKPGSCALPGWPTPAS